MSNKLTQESLARYIPDLWSYGMRLCASEENARGLICDTLDMALQKQWKRPASLALESWLNMTMYRVFLADYSKYGLGKEEGTIAVPFRQTIVNFETVH
jgi:DNA-directed RNA polymerase specialized sigma24 family protein